MFTVAVGSFALAASLAYRALLVPMTGVAGHLFLYGMLGGGETVAATAGRGRGCTPGIGVGIDA